MSLAGLNAPPELADPSAEVWHHQQRYHAFIKAYRWGLPCSERFGIATHPENRRRDALGEWAVDNGITRGPFPDWHRLGPALTTERTDHG